MDGERLQWTCLAGVGISGVVGTGGPSVSLIDPDALLFKFRFGRATGGLGGCCLFWRRYCLR